MKGEKRKGLRKKTLFTSEEVTLTVFQCLYHYLLAVLDVFKVSQFRLIGHFS